MMAAAKRGRKRNGDAERYPSGQIKNDPRTLEPAEFRRMRDAVEHEVLHEAWVCELWRRAHQGLISNEMRMAGDEFLRLRNEHRRVCELPPDTPKVASLERGFGRITVDIDAVNQEVRDRLIHYSDTVRKRWDRAVSELMDRKFGIAIYKATARLCFTNEHQAHGEFLMAKDGLAILARHFGLCKR